MTMTTEDDEFQPTRSTPTGTGAGRIDLRVSTIPTLHGEDMAIRLLVEHAASGGARPARNVAAGAQSTDRDARYPRRADPGQRTDRVGQDDDALCVPAAPEQRRAEDPHNRGPDRVRRARAPAVADQPEGRRRISRAAAERAPPVARRDPDRRDPRRDHGRDRDPRRQQRAPRAGLGARALRAGGRAEPARPGRQRAFPVQLAPGSDRPAIGPHALPSLQGGLRAGRLAADF